MAGGGRDVKILGRYLTMLTQKLAQSKAANLKDFADSARKLLHFNPTQIRELDRLARDARTLARNAKIGEEVSCQATALLGRAAGMSQTKVAHALGIQQTTVSWYEKQWGEKGLGSLTLKLDGGLEQRGIINRAQLKFSENDLAHLQRIARGDEVVKAKRATMLLHLHAGWSQREAAKAVGLDQAEASRALGKWRERGMEMFTNANQIARQSEINMKTLELDDQDLERLKNIATDKPTNRKQRRAKIIVLHASGLDQNDIAEEMGTSQSRVSLILTRWKTHRWEIFGKPPVPDTNPPTVTSKQTP